MSLKTDTRGVVVICEACGQANRHPYAALAQSTRCGKCRAHLSPPAAPVDVQSPADFDTLVRTATVPVLVDFWAAWCGPCRMVAPELVKVAAAHAGQWLVAKVDTEALPDVAARLQIQSIPTMAVFRGGRVAGRTAGAMPAAQIEQFVQHSLGHD